ncbi:MAG: type II CRISPR-associated endonuclease Cas1 [Spirochaetota bacterium]
MYEQVVEVQSSGCYLHQKRGLLELQHEGRKRLVDLDRIGVLLLSSPQATLSTPLLSECAQRNIPVLFCGGDYLPAAAMLPLDGHSRLQERVRLQVAVKLPKAKRLWQSIVQNKIQNQARLLQMAAGLGWHNRDCLNEAEEQELAKDLLAMSHKVLSGDSSMQEAVAARHYWPMLFGDDFRRSGPLPPNSLLNYGYTILLACVMRAINCCGLLGAFGIQHRSSRNPYCLASDLMEALRPFVDAFILHLYYHWGYEELNRACKQAISQLLRLEFEYCGEQSYLFRQILRYVQYFCATLESKEKNLPAIILTPNTVREVMELCASIPTK